MMVWVFAGITLSAVLMATFESKMRRAILALWVAGIGVGAMYLTIGAEFLAIVQWIVSTLVAISFIFFSVMFGEYQDKVEKSRVSFFSNKHTFLLILALLIGVGFTLIIGIGTSDLSNVVLLESSKESLKSADLKSLGKILTQDNLLSLEVLALTLFLTLVGGGVIARSEGGREK